MNRLQFCRTTVAAIGVSVAVIASSVYPATAQDFFSDLFGGDSGRQSSPRFPSLGYGAEDGVHVPQKTAPVQRAAPTRQAAYCVRTCDGRYFPVSGASNSGRVENCNTFCPATETQVFYGSSIESAVTERGKNYSALPNALKYRETLVADCSCNGKDSVGLVHVAPEEDKTIRKGDIVAGPEGLVVATRGVDKRAGRVANFSPASASIREKFAQNPSTSN